MQVLIGLLSHLATINVKRTVARTGRNGAFLVATSILFLTTYVFALIALAFWLAELYGPVAAASVIAAGSLLLGILVLIVMMIINAQEKRRERERHMAMESMMALGLSLFRTQPLFTAAIAAGLLASKTYHSRRKLD